MTLSSAAPPAAEQVHRDQLGPEDEVRRLAEDPTAGRGHQAGPGGHRVHPEDLQVGQVFFYHVFIEQENLERQKLFVNCLFGCLGDIFNSFLLRVSALDWESWLQRACPL